MTYQIRPSRLADALALAPRLRPADAAELKASGSCPTRALLDGLRASPFCLTVLTSGRPAMMFGVVPVDDLSASIWMLSDHQLEGPLRRPFLTEARDFIDWFHRDWPVLFNEVWDGNVVHIQWLRRMGFTFISRRTNEAGYTFLQFTRLKHV